MAAIYLLSETPNPVSPTCLTKRYPPLTNNAIPQRAKADRLVVSPEATTGLRESVLHKKKCKRDKWNKELSAFAVTFTAADMKQLT